MSRSFAVIPARGGSKRIPRKNIKEFCGKPMLAYSIEAALKTNLFSEVVVSTDDPEIAEVAKKYGAQVPFVRPSNLSDDFTPLAGVVEHSLVELQKLRATSYDFVCCILATAPFISWEDIKKSFHKMEEDSRVTAVVPVTSFPFPIFRALKARADGGMEMVMPEYEMTRSNDLPETFHDAGQFYWLRAQNFLEEKKIYSKQARPFHLPRWRVQDIDTPEDWERAEKLYRAFY